MRLAFHRLAAAELRESRDWYAHRSIKAAARFDDEVGAAVERVREDPTAFPVEIKSYRWVRVKRFPYRLIFEINERGAILILAVAHTSRRPGYWRHRPLRP